MRQFIIAAAMLGAAMLSPSLALADPGNGNGGVGNGRATATKNTNITVPPARLLVRDCQCWRLATAFIGS